MRLIDVEALRLMEYEPNTIANTAYTMGHNSVVREVLSAQTVDAVPVVRCKDCKYFDSSQTSDGGFICYCRHDDGLCDWIKEDYYCCLGERKEDSND